MRRIGPLVLLGALVACSSPSPNGPAQPGARSGLPAEVTALAERWQMCWHFSGEEPYDDARSKQIADGQAEWCPGNDVERARLQAKWKEDAAVQDALRKLDDMK